MDFKQDLTTLLRKQTASHHASAGKLVHLLMPFALSSPQVYRQLLLSFYHVFRVLEHELETRRLQYPKLAPIYFRQLQRTQSFHRDLTYYYHLPLPCLPAPSPAAAAYIADLRAAVHREPILLLAYTHSMYMALLSGGRVMKQCVVTAFGLKPPDGVAVFDFAPAIPHVDRFKSTYRDAINSLALSDAQKFRIVEQKKKVFEGNNAIMKEVCWSNVSRRRMAVCACRVVAALLVVLAVFSALHHFFFPAAAADGRPTSVFGDAAKATAAPH